MHHLVLVKLANSSIRVKTPYFPYFQCPYSQFLYLSAMELASVVLTFVEGDLMPVVLTVSVCSVLFVC